MSERVSGALIAESLRIGAPLDVSLTVRRVSRADVGDVDAGQPLTWTFIEFDLPVEQVEALAIALTGALDGTIGWYCDFRSDTETFVVFSGRMFRYPRGDPDRRAEVKDYARSVGVPEPQLDWPE